MRSFHQYPLFVPENATKLIVGSMPPERFCRIPKQLKEKDVDFYYGSKDNYFWKLLSEVCQTKLDYENTIQAVTHRKELLTSLHCGITDIIASCERSQNSASDSNLKEIIFQPIFQYALEHPTIKTLIYTSHFVQTNVYRYFASLFGKDWKKESINNSHRQHQLYFPDRLVLDDVTLYSPSPQALKGLGKNGKEKRTEQYRNVFQIV